MSEIIQTREKHLLWLTLNRPEQSNAFTPEMIEELVGALKDADRDPEMRVIILTGAGKSFCAGGDIKSMQNKSGMFAGESNELRRRYEFGIQQIPQTMESLQTPVIAMVNGAAIGAGCDLAAMCDLRIGSELARFGETFAKLGLVPGDGGSFFLTRVIGYAKAMEMALTGKIVDSEEALKIGLLNQLCAVQELEEKTRELAHTIASNAPVAISMIKKAMRASYLHDLQTCLDLLSAYQGITQRTSDHQEGLSSFKEKRPPQFKHQ